MSGSARNANTADTKQKADSVNCLLFCLLIAVMGAALYDFEHCDCRTLIIEIYLVDGAAGGFHLRDGSAQAGLILF